MFKFLDLFFLLGMKPLYIKNIGTNRENKNCLNCVRNKAALVLRHLKSIFLFFLFICAKKSWEVSQEVNNVDLSPRSIGNRCPFDQKHATPRVSQWYRRYRSCSFNAIFFKVAIAVFSLYGLSLRHKYTDMRHNDTEKQKSRDTLR